MKYSQFALVVILVATAAFASTRADERVDRTADEAAIKQIAKDWGDAWNKHDADGLTSLLADEVDFVTVLGPKGWLKGREQFRQAHAAMHKTLFTDSVWTTKEVYVKFLRDDLAIARVLWATTGDKVRHIKHGEPREGIFTWVVEKRGGKWMIVASQNTESMPPLPGQ